MVAETRKTRQARETEEKKAKEVGEAAIWTVIFWHPDASVTSDDFDDNAVQLWFVTNLTRYKGEPLAWQHEGLDVWKKLVTATDEYNQRHPNWMHMPQECFPEVFKYLADRPGMFFTPYELESSKADKKDTIDQCIEQVEANLDAKEGRVQLDFEVQQYMVPGSGPIDRGGEELDVSIVKRGVPIMRYEWVWLSTVLGVADYRESDPWDQNWALLQKDLSDEQIHLKVLMLEQVINMACRMVLKKLPTSVWEALEQLKFGTGEALHLLREYLESAGGHNTDYLKWLFWEGFQRDVLGWGNSMNWVLSHRRNFTSQAHQCC